MKIRKANLSYLLFLFLISSCITANRVNKFLDKNPEFNSKNCSDRFPSYSDTIIKYKWDTINLETIKYGKHDSIFIVQPRKEAIGVKTLVKTITITKENTAKVFWLQKLKTQDSISFIKERINLRSEIEDIILDCNKKDLKISKMRRREGWYWIILLLLSFWIVRKRILKLIATFL